MRRHYSRQSKEKIVFLIILVAVLVVVAFLTGMRSGQAADDEVTCWILCKYKSQVTIRAKPDTGSREYGWLEVGDSFRTDGKVKNGFVHALGVGDNGEGWIFGGYVVYEEPQAVFENYVCVARKQVACRRWINGPQVEHSPWLRNGSSVSVFYIADGWAVTSRGYIQSEWIEPDPE